jgi:hypothetical protein
MILRFLGLLFQKVFGGLFGSRASNASSLRGAAASALGEMEDGMRAQAAAVHHDLVRMRRTLPPLVLIRQPATDVAWLQEPEATRRLNGLREAGFAEGEACQYQGLPNVLGFDLLDPTRTLRATLAKSGSKWVLELDVHLEDGTVVALCDSEIPRGITAPPWIRREYRPAAEPEELIRTFTETIRGMPVKQGDLALFRALSAESFRRLQEWRAERGGWTMEEIRAQRGVAAEAPVTEELETAHQQNVERWITCWLRLQPQLPFDLDARLESLLYVHDRMDWAALQLQWVVLTEDTGVRGTEFGEGSPREALDRVNKSRGCPLALVFQKTTEPRVDFYLPAVHPRIIALQGPLGDALEKGLRRNDLRKCLFALGKYRISTREEAEALGAAVAYLESSTRPVSEGDLKALVRIVTQVQEGSAAVEPLRELVLDPMERLVRRVTGAKGAS